MASAIALLVRGTLESEFRRIDPASARIVLVDAGSRVLRSFSEDLSRAATKELEKLGVEVRLGHAVDHIDGEGVVVAGERILSKTVIWTAGVAPSRAGKWLNVETDRAGRVRVQQDLTVPGHPEILVVGKNFAVLESGKLHIHGFLAWLAWAAVHLEFLAQSNLRVSVFLQWVWTYLTGQRGSRLIVNHYGSERRSAAADAPHEAMASSK